jgi:A/G-specific adenine glycosylase
MNRPERLLAWYDRNRRDLPWRGRTDPWATWVSEVMLQQTRVETAIPYFHNFLARFPTPGALAAASAEEVLAAWSGLGYYRRARQLQAAARELQSAGRALPSTAAELEKLPGVGPYTAAAIASIAFGEAVPVVDGNVERVLARFSAEGEPVAKSAVRRRLFDLARSFLAPGRPGDSNQALMELGATVCLPASPRCGSCPLADGCAARLAGASARYPVRAKAPTPRRVRQLAAIVEERGRLLLFRRPDDAGQLAGLWELPLVEARGRGAATSALTHRFGGEWAIGERVATIRHAITAKSFVIAAHRATFAPVADEIREGVEAGWFAREPAAALALSGAARKLLAKV